MYFGLKKFISQFLMPMPLVCECFLLGWVLYRFTKYKKTGRFFTLLSLLFFLLFGYGFGRTFLYNLERRYPAFDPTPEQCEALRGAPVVVLGQGMPKKSDLPIRYQNNPVFDRRLFEGVRVAKLIPESRLIVSMAGEASDCIKQAFLDEYMIQANFPTNRVSMFTTARDTSEEASCAKLLIGGQRAEVRSQKSEGRGQSLTNELTQSRTNELLPTSDLRPPTSATNALSHYRTNELANFRTLELHRHGVASSEAGSNFRTNESSSSHSQNFRTLELPGRRSFSEGGSNFRTNVLILATSASHMPRSMKIFQTQGLSPIASPCDYTELEPSKINLQWPYLPLPSGSNFETSQRALYEWLGNLYERAF